MFSGNFNPNRIDEDDLIPKSDRSEPDQYKIEVDPILSMVEDYGLFCVDDKVFRKLRLSDVETTLTPIQRVKDNSIYMAYEKMSIDKILD